MRKLIVTTLAILLLASVAGADSLENIRKESKHWMPYIRSGYFVIIDKPIEECNKDQLAMLDRAISDHKNYPVIHPQGYHYFVGEGKDKIEGIVTENWIELKKSHIIQVLGKFDIVNPADVNEILLMAKDTYNKQIKK